MADELERLYQTMYASVVRFLYRKVWDQDRAEDGDREVVGEEPGKRAGLAHPPDVIEALLDVVEQGEDRRQQGADAEDPQLGEIGVADVGEDRIDELLGAEGEPIHPARVYGELWRILDRDAVVIGEATHGDICIGHRGRAELEVIIHGLAGHASAPSRALNALALLPAVLEGCWELRGDQPSDPLLGPATVTPTSVEALPESRNVIPDRVTVVLDWRILPDTREETLLARVWGDSAYRDPRTIDVHIRHLREKFSDMRSIEPTDLATELARAFLPGMLRGRGGAIVNVCSMASFQPVPYLATYAASKAFVLAYTQALAAELRHEPIDVLTLCPGATRTAFGRRAGFGPGNLPGADDPAVVARQALRALGRRSIHVMGPITRSLLRPGLTAQYLASQGLGMLMRTAGRAL